MTRPKTATQFILRGLFLPLSHENLLLSFKPSQFFYELSRVSSYSSATLKKSYYRAKESGLFEVDENAIPRLTAKGLRKVSPFISKKLSQKGRLLVIFDIPENQSKARDTFRRLLKNLGFKQVQLSVWVTDVDHRKVLKETIREFKLEQYVQLYEAAQLQ